MKDKLLHCTSPTIKKCLVGVSLFRFCRPLTLHLNVDLNPAKESFLRLPIFSGDQSERRLWSKFCSTRSSITWGLWFSISDDTQYLWQIRKLQIRKIQIKVCISKTLEKLYLHLHLFLFLSIYSYAYIYMYIQKTILLRNSFLFWFSTGC